MRHKGPGEGWARGFARVAHISLPLGYVGLFLFVTLQPGVSGLTLGLINGGPCTSGSLLSLDTDRSFEKRFWEISSGPFGALPQSSRAIHCPAAAGWKVPALTLTLHRTIPGKTGSWSAKPRRTSRYQIPCAPIATS